MAKHPLRPQLSERRKDVQEFIAQHEALRPVLEEYLVDLEAELDEVRSDGEAEEAFDRFQDRLAPVHRRAPMPLMMYLGELRDLAVGIANRNI